ncbi:hypothetical protein JNK13_01550 [bacterium]|nr:hypothetical protein [bacterium]
MYKFLASLAIIFGFALAANAEIKMCTQSPRFKPCVCYNTVPKSIKYRPSDPNCPMSRYPGDTNNHVASVILSGKFQSAFSTVVRTRSNADRSPRNDWFSRTHCTLEEHNAGERKCSAWKVQDEYDGEGVRGLCFGASGYSKVFEQIRRITIKATSRRLHKVGGGRYCLKKPTVNLN